MLQDTDIKSALVNVTEEEEFHRMNMVWTHLSEWKSRVIVPRTGEGGAVCAVFTAVKRRLGATLNQPQQNRDQETTCSR